MILLLLLPLALATLAGLIAGWRTRPDAGWSLVAIVQILSSAILVGALVVAAEAGSASARNLGLLALMAGSAALCGGAVVALRFGRAQGSS